MSTLGFPVQKHQCASCIYRPASPLDRAKLEAAIADPNMAGYFTSYRVCHHSHGQEACCRGFWDRHKDDFHLGQLAQRLGFVEEVEVDTLAKKRQKHRQPPGAVGVRTDGGGKR